ncbi:uncharacterized protein SAPINGB_P004553 [Magnusiomyces paraingens]|uniref:HECT-type E3 ubiquitin transferase n=1 Tax=Magnusiomyces paraingens TaxID=2606893 RepID=A0A5E8BW76_9ASCO|nr:uncharacterized protein SAPINGB_P004553 [Saprochaete ingens]VVT55351.1 unnamed protein product [Saprochaete ingens]
MYGMNFTGQHRRARHINLGGRNATASSKDSVVRRAQFDRERREKARKEENAAIKIQSFYRSRKEVESIRHEIETQWNSSFLGSTELVIMSQPQLTNCLLQFNFFFKYTFSGSSTNEEQVKFILKILKNNIDQFQEKQIDAHLVVTLIDTLSTVLRPKTKSKQTTIIESAPKPIDADILYALELLQDFSSTGLLPTCGAYIQSITANHITLTAPNQYYNKNTKAITIVRDSLIKIISHQIESYSHAIDFFASFLSTPGLHVFFTSSQFLPYSNALKTFINKYSALDPSKAPVISQENLVWRLVNFYHFFGTLADQSLFYQTLNIFISPINIQIEPPSKTTTAKRLKKLSENPIFLLSTNDFVITKLNELTGRSFFTSIMDTLLGSPEFNLPLFSSIVTSLTSLYPIKKQQIVMFITLSPLAVIQQLWETIKSTSLCQMVLEKSPDKNTLARILLDEEPMPAGQVNGAQTVSLLSLFLDLYSYWLIVANDAEFHGTSTTHGLPKQNVKDLAQFLRNICFSLLWNASEISTDQKLNSLLNVAPLSVTNSCVLVMRQIYIRDSRRQFLPNDFWLMINNFQIEHFISSVVQEEEQLRRENEARNMEVDDELSDSDSDNEDDVEQESYRQSKISDSNPRSLGGIVPRLEILRQAPFFIPFDTRLKIFQEFIENLRAEEAATNPPTLNFFGLESRQTGVIRRDYLLEDAYTAFNKLGSDFRQPIAVRFSNEYGVEAGVGAGITKEFLTIISKTAFKPSPDNEYNMETKEGLFVSSGEHLLFPNPILGVSRKYTNLDHEEKLDANRYMVFLGKIIGKCLYENILVDVEFAPFFLQKWAAAGMGYRNSFDDLYSFDPELYENLIKLYNYPGNVEDLMLDFSINQEVGHGLKSVVELKPNGANIPVTNANRLEYIHAVANYKLNIVLHQQTSLFLQGLSVILPPRWLSMFNAREIQMLISGRPAAINIDDLRKNSVLINFEENDDTIKYFWEVVEELSDEDKSRFIKFVTSVPKAPLLGFEALNPHFAIRNAGPDEQRLPTSSTCINLIKLPAYKSKKILREKILNSIHADAGFELS